MVVLGKNLIVSLDGIPIAAARTCKLNLEQEFIEACSPADSRVILSIPTLYRWGVSVDGLVGYIGNEYSSVLANRLKRGTKCLITFTDNVLQQRAGWVYVKNFDQTGTVGSVATYSASFQPTGPLYDYGTVNPSTMQNNLTLTAINIDIGYNFDSESHTLGTGITTVTEETLFVRVNTDWVLYNLPFADVVTAITNRDTATLNAKVWAFGNSQYPMDTITLPENTTASIVMNANATVKSIYRLQ